MSNLIDFINCNLRFVELSEEEKEDFISSVEGSAQFTNEMRQTLANCNTEKQRQHHYLAWATSKHFCECVWSGYLRGETKTKPSVQEKELEAA